MLVQTTHRLLLPKVAGNKTRKPYNAVLQGIYISRANRYVQRKRNAIHLYARVPYIYIKRQTTLIVVCLITLSILLLGGSLPSIVIISA